jgi:hypothetical protein
LIIYHLQFTIQALYVRKTYPYLGFLPLSDRHGYEPFYLLAEGGVPREVVLEVLRSRPQEFSGGFLGLIHDEDKHGITSDKPSLKTSFRDASQPADELSRGYRNQGSSRVSHRGVSSGRLSLVVSMCT